MVAAGCRRTDGLPGCSWRKVSVTRRTGSPKSRSERLKSGPESAGSSPARDKAFGHRIFRRLRFLLRQVTPPFFASKYGIESTQAAELLCLFIYTGFCADCSAHHQSTERCAAVLPSAAKDKSFQSND